QYDRSDGSGVLEELHSVRSRSPVMCWSRVFLCRTFARTPMGSGSRPGSMVTTIFFQSLTGSWHLPSRLLPPTTSGSPQLSESTRALPQPARNAAIVTSLVSTRHCKEVFSDFA